jgi:hypothetical protein
MAHWHDYNPWADRLIYIPSLEELAEALQYPGIISEKVKQWQKAGKKLDAYVLCQPSGDHCMGIRYGAEPHEYISPYGNREKLQRLIDKYGPHNV